MMGRLMQRAEAAVRHAQAQRLEQIARTVRSKGLVAEVAADSIVVRGRRLAQRWLGDPVLRFVGKRAG